MRHIGILGHSIPGSAHCYQAIARHGEQRLGEHQHPDVTLDCIPMGRSMPAWESGDRAAIREILAESVERLARAGCDFYVCPDNTAHLALDLPGPSLALPGLHIADVVAAEAAARGFRCVGILGTRWTMTAPMYPEALAAHGIDSRSPSPADQDDIQRITFGELVRGVFTQEARERFAAVVESLRSEGCDAVALVCTEHPLLLTADVAPLPTLDSTDLLARAAVDEALKT
ncbi:aspartate/glutamate racemase family protein [Kibdelosporangium phytohabitans]|uniref:Aspartate racemase n=1 Tax=Kibdelosporangium phytohabitans TaxID=860235 RepID=A0A0N9I488_9PSEU|nr:amino acid racemase [Kibdelosporangium phytohabitans]ALG09392.1 aspartate racemase [Kibdelosporangium phytohabitans]MBE1469338.1 aspartate racemase [Kibdelosporangium phytohabitans]